MREVEGTGGRKARQPAKHNTVQIDGVVIASFLYGDDAQFFARAANEAGLFTLTNPGKEAVAYDRNGAMLEPALYRPR